MGGDGVVVACQLARCRDGQLTYLAGLKLSFSQN